MLVVEAHAVGGSDLVSHIQKCHLLLGHAVPSIAGGSPRRGLLNDHLAQGTIADAEAGEARIGEKFAPINGQRVDLAADDVGRVGVARRR